MSGRSQSGRCRLRWLALAALLAAGVVAAQPVAPSYPNKVVRIQTTEAGGYPDAVARLIAQGLSASLGQQVIIENRAIAAVEVAAKAPPDGYTLLFYTSVLWLSPFLREGLSWDPVRDFAAVMLATHSPNLLVVHPSLPVKSVGELMALARKRPGELNYSTSSSGSGNHLAAELFRVMAGVNVIRINYRGSASALNSLAAGEVQLSFPSAGSVMPYLRAGRVRALAVTSAQPSALAPDLPTVAAAGLPGYEATAYNGLLAPAKTPPAIIAKLNQEAVQWMRRVEVKERIVTDGGEVIAGTPEEFAATMRLEMAKWGRLIREAGIRGE
jgi:tripartite-type tricarboxylate transporter receptor subunit TctC